MGFRDHKLAIANVNTGDIDPLRGCAALGAAHIVSAGKYVTDLEISRSKGSGSATLYATVVARHQHLVIVGRSGDHVTGAVKDLALDGEPAVGADDGCQINVGCFIGLFDNGREGAGLFGHIILQCIHFSLGQHTGGNIPGLAGRSGDGHHAGGGVAVAVYGDDGFACGNCGDLTGCIHSSYRSVGRSPGSSGGIGCGGGILGSHQGHIVADFQLCCGLIQADALDGVTCQALGAEDEVVFVCRIQCGGIAPVGGHTIGQGHAVFIHVDLSTAGRITGSLAYHELAVTNIDAGQIGPAAVAALGGSRSDDIAHLQISRCEGLAFAELGAAGVAGDQHLGVIGFCGAYHLLAQIVEANVGVERIHFNACGIVGRCYKGIPQSCGIRGVAADGGQLIGSQHAFRDVAGFFDLHAGQTLGTEDEVVLISALQRINILAPEGNLAVCQRHAVFVYIDCRAAFGTIIGIAGHQELAVTDVQAGQILPTAVLALGGSGSNDVANLQVSRHKGTAGGSHLAAAGVAGHQHLGVIGFAACKNLCTQSIEGNVGIEGFHIDTGSLVSGVDDLIPHTGRIHSMTGNNRLFCLGQQAVLNVAGVDLDLALYGQSVTGQADIGFAFCNCGDLAVCIHRGNAGVRAFPNRIFNGNGGGVGRVGQSKLLSNAQLCIGLAQNQIHQMLAGQALGTKHIVVHICAVHILQACPNSAGLGGLAGNILIQAAVGLAAHLADKELAVALVDADDILPLVAALVVHKAAEDVADLEVLRGEGLAGGDGGCCVLCAAIVAGHQHLMEVGVAGDQQAGICKQLLAGVVYIQGQILGHINAGIAVSIGRESFQLGLLIGGIIGKLILFCAGQLAGGNISVLIGLGLLQAVRHLLGTEQEVVDPFLGHIVADESPVHHIGLTEAAAGRFGDQPLAAALVQGYQVNIPFFALSCGAEDIAYLHIGIGEDLPVLNGDVLTAVAVGHQHIRKGCVVAVIALLHGHIVAVFLIVSEDARPGLGNRNTLGKVSAQVDVGFLVGPVGEVGQNLRPLGIQPGIQIQACNDFLLLLGQLAGVHIPQDHGVDIVVRSGGTEDNIAFIEVVLSHFLIDGLCQPADQLLIGGDLLVKPVDHLAAGGNVFLHLCNSHELAVALVNRAQISTDGTPAHDQHVTGIQLIQIGQRNGVLVDRTAIVQQHLVKGVAAFGGRCCQSVQVLIDIYKRIRVVAVVFEAGLNHACVGVFLNTVGDDIQANGGVDQTGIGQIHRLTLFCQHALGGELLQSCNGFLVEQNIAGLKDEHIHCVLSVRSAAGPS